MPPTTFPTTEGDVDFVAPGTDTPCKTWYKIVGELSSTSVTTSPPPLILLHGGPGAGHEYMLPFADLYEKHGIPAVIFYDQIGCGRSTHFRDKMGDTSFWTFDLFIDELDNLIDKLKLRETGFDLLGQSWGGSLIGVYAARRPRGLRRAIIASGLASAPLYKHGCKPLIAALPPDVRKIIQDCIRNGDYESEDFERASAEWNSRYLCRLDPLPDDLMAGFNHLKEDPTSYVTIQGPSEFVIIGSLKDWEGWTDAHKIEAETLLINGRYDEMTDVCMEPWFKHIPKVSWVKMENSSHMGHFEERERFMDVCGGFLNK